jgi:hypothetical protein
LNELPPASAGGPQKQIQKGFSQIIVIIIQTIHYKISAKAIVISPFIQQAKACGNS